MTDKPKYPDHVQIDVEPKVEAGVEAQSPQCELVFEDDAVLLRCNSKADAQTAVERLKSTLVKVEIAPQDNDPPSTEGESEEEEGTDD